MPTPILWARPGSAAVYRTNGFADDEGALGNDQLVSLNTGRYLSSVTFDLPPDHSGDKTHLEIAIRNADGSLVREFNASRTNESDFPPPGSRVTDVDGVTTAALNDGRFVAVWAERRDFGLDRSGLGILFQIYDQFGQVVGNQVQVNTKLSGNQSDPTVTALANGSFVVSWLDATAGDIRAQVFSAAGAKIGGEIIVNTITAGAQNDQTIVALEGGGFLAVWEDTSHFGADASGSAIHAQRFSATGTRIGGEILVNATHTGNQRDPVAVALNNGGYAIFWTDTSESGGDPDGTAVRGQFFAANHARVGGEILINTSTAGDQGFPNITVLDGGNVVVAWHEDVGGTTDAKAQIFSETGARIGGEFSVSTEAGEERLPRVLGLSDGNFLVFWSTGGGEVPAEAGVWYQLFDSNGARIGSELQFHTHTIESGFFFTGFTSLTELADGRVVAAWSLSGFDNINPAKTNFQVIIDPRQGAVNLFRTAQGDNLIGTQFDDVISGGAGDDTLEGAGGEDSLFGGDGNDILQATDDGDLLDGGAGTDTVSYQFASGGVFVTLNGQSVDGDQYFGIENFIGSRYNDVLIGSNAINTLRGGAGDDDLVGNGGNDVLSGELGSDEINGGSGNDILNGGAGIDRLDGGTGNDTLIGGADTDFFFVDSAGDVVRELSNQGMFDRVVASVSYALPAGQEIELLNTDNPYNRIEINFTGNEFANEIQGNNSKNILDGRGGADRLLGLASNDTYFVDAGDKIVDSSGVDNLNASQSYVLGVNVSVELLRTVNAAAVTAINLTGNNLVNIVIGNAGNNALNGGGGADTLQGLGGNDSYVVDNAADKIVETSGRGTDNVNASVSYVLAANVSVETLRTVNAAATTAINLTGNALAKHRYW